MSNLSKPELLRKILDALAMSGWVTTTIRTNKPFLIRAVAPDGSRFMLRFFIWNCTHGGGAARAPDEYRIQFTGAMPDSDGSAITVLLGWHDGYGVFAAWDLRFHDNQGTSSSPSAQIREEALSNAHKTSFATLEKANGEIVVAFRPEFLADYIVASSSLHQTGISPVEIQALNSISTVDESDLSKIPAIERRQVVASIVRKFRAYDFRKRVLSAYGFRCAVCGVQLELIDAAHIEPVSQEGSSDETCNGIALCKIHHAAYDNLLISFDESYKIQLREARLTALKSMDRHAGDSAFKAALKPVIILPADRRDYPKVEYIRRSRKSRGWAA